MKTGDRMLRKRVHLPSRRATTPTAMSGIRRIVIHKRRLLLFLRRILRRASVGKGRVSRTAGCVSVVMHSGGRSDRGWRDDSFLGSIIERATWGTGSPDALIATGRRVGGAFVYRMRRIRRIGGSSFAYIRHVITG